MQNQLIFYFLNCYHVAKIKGEDHSNTSNTKDRRLLVMQANEVNLLYDLSPRQYFISTQVSFAKSEYI